MVAWRRLTGGIGSAVHRLTLERKGDRRFLVLRRYEHLDSSRFVDQESFALRELRRSELPVPDLVASDPNGSSSGGHPALLMTRVPGSILLTPDDPDAWLRQMATVAATIHDLAIPAQPFEPWFHPEERSAPASAARPDLWQSAYDVLTQEGPAVRHVFVHRDFQHFNLLWSRGRLSGIVDWTFASTGPREIDAGHCRLNLAVLHGADWSERFRLAYEAEAGVPLDPWWDLHACASYSDHMMESIPVQVDGRTSVDVRGMTQRVEDLVASTMQHL